MGCCWITEDSFASQIPSLSIPWTSETTRCKSYEELTSQNRYPPPCASRLRRHSSRALSVATTDASSQPFRVAFAPRADTLSAHEYDTRYWWQTRRARSKASSCCFDAGDDFEKKSGRRTTREKLLGRWTKKIVNALSCTDFERSVLVGTLASERFFLASSSLAKTVGRRAFHYVRQCAVAPNTR